jgi:hypothetical protein
MVPYMFLMICRELFSGSGIPKKKSDHPYFFNKGTSISAIIAKPLSER